MIRWRDISIVVVLVTSACFVGGCYDDASKTNDFTKSVVPPDFVPYNGAKFIIKCPSDWTVKFEQKTLMIRPPKQASDDAFPPLMMIDAFSLPDIPLKNGIRDVEQKLTDMIDEPSLKKSEPAILPSASEAWELVYTGTHNGGVQRKWMQIIARKGTDAFVITYSANPAKFDALVPTVEQILASFQIYPYGAPDYGTGRSGRSSSQPTTAK